MKFKEHKITIKQTKCVIYQDKTEPSHRCAFPIILWHFSAVKYDPLNDSPLHEQLPLLFQAAEKKQFSNLVNSTEIGICERAVISNEIYIVYNNTPHPQANTNKEWTSCLQVRRVGYMPTPDAGGRISNPSASDRNPYQLWVRPPVNQTLLTPPETAVMESKKEKKDWNLTNTVVLWIAWWIDSWEMSV